MDGWDGYFMTDGTGHSFSRVLVRQAPPGPRPHPSGVETSSWDCPVPGLVSVDSSPLCLGLVSGDCMHIIRLQGPISLSPAQGKREPAPSRGLRCWRWRWRESGVDDGGWMAPVDGGKRELQGVLKNWMGHLDVFRDVSLR